MVEKCQISRAFGRAAANYDQLAIFQRHVCEKMICRLPEIMPSGFTVKTILDAGCGTGFGIMSLSSLFSAAMITGIDLSEDMVRQCRRHGFHAHTGDMEALDFSDAAFDLYFSSLALQWCNPNAVLTCAKRVLKPHGLLYCSTLAPGSLPELATAFSSDTKNANMLTLPAAPYLEALLKQIGFENIFVHREEIVMHYDTPLDALQSVRGIGANGLPRPITYLGKQTFMNALNKLEAMRTPDGIPLTYQLLTLSATR